MHGGLDREPGGYFGPVGDFQRGFIGCQRCCGGLPELGAGVAAREQDAELVLVPAGQQPLVAQPQAIGIVEGIHVAVRDTVAKEQRQALRWVVFFPEHGLLSEKVGAAVDAPHGIAQGIGVDEIVEARGVAPVADGVLADFFSGTKTGSLSGKIYRQKSNNE